MATASKEQTILLVDEDLDFLDWATKHLEDGDLRILRCDNGENAVKVADKAKIDLVISDIQIKPFDGLELLSRIRAKNPNAAVILTAGFPSTSQIIEATRRGAQDVLRKESLPFELRPVVESALQNLEHRERAHDNIAQLKVHTLEHTYSIGEEDEKQQLAQNTTFAGTSCHRKSW